MPDHEFDRIKLLLDYTKFHIGLYVTLIAALISLFSFGSDAISETHICYLKITTVFFVFAGMAGGIIGSNIPEHSSFSVFWEKRIGFWGFPIMATKYWARVEHLTFWLGMLIGITPIIFGS